MLFLSVENVAVMLQKCTKIRDGKKEMVLKTLGL